MTRTHGLRDGARYFTFVPNMMADPITINWIDGEKILVLESGIAGSLIRNSYARHPTEDEVNEYLDEQDADAKAKADSDAKSKADADAKSKADADAKSKADADAKAKADADAKSKADADAKAKADADAKSKADADAKAKADAEGKK